MTTFSKHRPVEALDALNTAAMRSRVEASAVRLVAETRTRLVMGHEPQHVFFAVLALRLRVKADWGIPTAAVDGKTMYYNPQFISDMTPDERLGLVCHEVMHCALGHHVRRGERKPRMWNIAADLAINHLLLKSGMKLPNGGCVPGQGEFRDMPENLTAEEYYSRLQQSGKNFDGEGDDPGGCGSVMDAGEGDQAKQKLSEAEWNVATIQATTAARQRGQLPADLDRAVGEAVKPQTDWRAVLRRFVNSFAKDDYSWARPNRRYISRGIYLPSMHSEELGRVILAVDTSGSIGPEMLNLFAGEIGAILDSYAVKLTILYHDSAVAHEQEWSSQDGPIQMEPKGGGGTSHVPVFERATEEDRPTCMICLTDGYTEFPPDEPGFPVLWAMTTDVQAPWGEVVRIRDEG